MESNWYTVSEIEEASLTTLGESPHWDSKTGTLIYVDILCKRVLVYNPSTRTSISQQFSQQVGFAIPFRGSRRSGDGLLLCVGLEDCIVECDFNGKKSNETVLKTLARVPDSMKIEGLTRFNDARATPSGVLYAGYMHSKWREGKDKAGRLLKMIPVPQPSCECSASPGDEVSGHLVTALTPEQIHLPNGSVWLRGVEDDGVEICYIIDSANHSIRKYSARISKLHLHQNSNPMGVHDDARGDIHKPAPTPRQDTSNSELCSLSKHEHDTFHLLEGGNSRANHTLETDGHKHVQEDGEEDNVVFRLDEESIKQGFMMDGMCVDNKKNLWIAVPGSYCVICVDPIQKKEIHRIKLPAKKPTACCFGGSDLRTLFVTTRNDGADLDPQGKLFQVTFTAESGISGLGPGLSVAPLRSSDLPAPSFTTQLCCILPSFLNLGNFFNFGDGNHSPPQRAHAKK